MISRYRRNGRVVEAILFDGSAEAGSEISRSFSGAAAHDDGQVEVVTAYGRVYAGMGCWIVRDCKTRVLSVIGDGEFTAFYEQIEDASALEQRSFARSPEHRGGLV